MTLGLSIYNGGVEPLNAKLYNALKQRFGVVRISNQGQRWISRLAVSAIESSKRRQLKEKVLDSGEYYRVDCPYCGDTRQRLYINYRWNTLDDSGKTFGRHLAYCFNENCDMHFLEEEFKAYMDQRPRIERPSELKLADTASFKEVKLPGRCVALGDLPVNHPALSYLRGRGISPGELAVEWQVCFCVDAPRNEGYHSGLVRNRLVIPIFWEGKMVGWQTRAIDDSLPKYYTMPGLKKTQMLFNGDRASQYKFGVVVEGVFDAFKVGPRAVALLGMEVSFRQKELILAYWSRGAVCIMLDPEALDDMKRMDRLNDMLGSENFRWGSFTLSLPPGEDPGSMKREDLWYLIVNYARTRNIPLDSL